MWNSGKLIKLIKLYKVGSGPKNCPGRIFRAFIDKVLKPYLWIADVSILDIFSSKVMFIMID